VQSSDEEGEDSDEEDEDGAEEEAPAPRGGKRKSAPVAAKKAPAKRGAAKADSDEESEASEEGEASEDSDDSDLFDSEEEELISKRVQDGKGGKVLGGKRKAAGSDEGDGDGRAVSTRSSRRVAASKYESDDDGASEVSSERLRRLLLCVYKGGRRLPPSVLFYVKVCIFMPVFAQQMSLLNSQAVSLLLTALSLLFAIFSVR
jgi:hypothetical protein